MPRSGGIFRVELIDERPGFAALTLEGPKAYEIFKQEAGGHRWQRIPPTEKRGRVQTSTVTVAIFEIKDSKNPDLTDIEIRTTRGTGPGGQHKNTTESCVIATHRPTGLQARADMRSQHQSKAMALKILTAKLLDRDKQITQETQAADRRKQVGSGMRGDKIRTYSSRHNHVVDHRTGKRWKLNAWIRGEW